MPQSSGNLYKYTDLMLLENRMATLQDWPVSFINKEDVALSGFYYFNTNSSKPDSVQCVSCHQIVHSWEPGDRPNDHHHENCSFFQRSNMSFDYFPKNSRYVSNEARYVSFRTAPRSLLDKIDELIHAGFYYLSSDKIACYYCNLHLYAWKRTADPWKEHVHFSPRCTYARVIKGREFIEDVKKNYTPLVKQNIHEELFTEEHENISTEDICIICLSAIRNVCFIPCGHLVTCTRCAATIRDCPVCRVKFSTSVRIYAS